MTKNVNVVLYSLYQLFLPFSIGGIWEIKEVVQ